MKPASSLTPASHRALRLAASGRSGLLFPIPPALRVYGDAINQLRDGLVRRGLVTDEENPAITETGRRHLDAKGALHG